MPSPFPGMDPYLENPEIFPDLHDSLCFCFSEQLQACLPDPYYAATASRVWIESVERYKEPDVSLLRHRDTPGNASGAVAVAEPYSGAVVVTIPGEEFRESYVEILTRKHGPERLVTAIEVLSPSNKRPGEGRTLYLEKQRELVAGKAHLVEIDLLRGETHTTAIPGGPTAARTGPFDYHVCVHQCDRRFDFLVYPIRLPDRLPTVAVPLLPGDGAVSLDLAAAFNRAYDTGPYRRRVRYGTDEIVPALPPKESEWVKRVLTGDVRATA